MVQHIKKKNKKTQQITGKKCCFWRHENVLIRKPSHSLCFAISRDTCLSIYMARRGRNHLVVGFTTTYAISAYHHWCCEFETLSRQGVQHYVIKFVSDLRQVYGFLRILRFLPPIKLTSRYYWNIVEKGVKHHKTNKPWSKYHNNYLHNGKHQLHPVCHKIPNHRHYLLKIPNVGLWTKSFFVH